MHAGGCVSVEYGFTKFYYVIKSVALWRISLKTRRLIK